MIKHVIDFDKLILEGVDNDPSLQRLFWVIESGDALHYALIGADSKTVEKYCRNISVRRARKLKEVLAQKCCFLFKPEKVRVFSLKDIFHTLGMIFVAV